MAVIFNQFATPTGWVDANDGILVRDLDGNGRIDDDSEMFGGPQAAGFAQLATLKRTRGSGVLAR